MTQEEKEKASLAELNSLHGLVAKSLADNLDDPKVLGLAIKFLKDNDITADLLESEDTVTLAESIKTIAKKSGAKNLTVEEMLNIGSED